MLSKSYRIGDVNVIRSKRKTIAIQIMPDLRVVLRAPVKASDRQIEDFAQSKSQWIESSLNQLACNHFRDSEPLSQKAITMLKAQAREDLTSRIKIYGPLLGVDWGQIRIGCYRTRWGSCSVKGDLSFNCLLIYAPPFVRDYIVVHELCHRRHMNHSAEYWQNVESVFPSYKTAKVWLKENELALISLLSA